MSTCACCSRWYSPLDYTTDEGYCPSCFSSASSYGYANKEWVLEQVSNGNQSQYNHNENDN